MQTYNWYSTNSHQRFKRTIINEPRLTQFSDEGRFPLGSASDPENAEMRDRIIESVSEETLHKWVDFQTEMRDKCSLRKRQLGLTEDAVDEKLRTFPKKQFVIEDEAEAASDGSQHGYDRSKYVLNRKINPIPSTISATPAAESTSSDQIFVDGSDSQPSTTRWIFSEKENDSDKRDCQVTRVSTSSQDSSPRKIANVTSENGSTLLVTVPSSSSTTSAVQECILNKYGHCFAPKLCPFAHNGIVRNIGRKRKRTVSSGWKRKLPNIPLCSGYLNFQCWNFDCDKRHVLYPSDTV